MIQDRNKKELGVGDEVVVHFRVTAVWPQTEEGRGTLDMECVHNAVISNEALPPIVIRGAESSAVILQRKAKP